MTKPSPLFRLILRNSQRTVLPLAILCALSMLGVQPARAQTFSVIHSFTGNQDGGNPASTLTLDMAGNLYGTTVFGGDFGGRNCGSGGGCGVVFKMARHNTTWVLTPLYSFTGFDDGAGPIAPVIFGPNGALYGTADGGGSGNCTRGYWPGCGVVFQLQPPPTRCTIALCPWLETPIYQFTQESDGWEPDAPVVFDSAGNLYGTTSGNSSVYQLTRSGSGWVKTTIYTFTNSDGPSDRAGLIIDQAGRLYGISNLGVYGYGAVFQLTRSGSDWTENTIYSFRNGMDGRFPVGLTMDALGNLYGAASGGGIGGGGTVFELSSSGGGWTFTLLSSLVGNPAGAGPSAAPTFDNAGNLYDTSSGGGLFGCGDVFRLTPSGGRWIYTELYDFTCGNDGGVPYGGVAADTSRNLYGTTLYYGPTNGQYCGEPIAPVGCGVAWKIAP